jgi:hypothetical protein
VQPKNILIICWDFPPNNAIGGRRWAKIAKSLLKFGHSVSVIAHAPLKLPKKMPWISDKEMSKINFFGCSEFFLARWLHDYDSSLKFFKLHLSGFLLNIFARGTIFDKTLGIEKKLLFLAEKVINEKKLDTIFVTGAPFNLMYYTAHLKQKFPEIKILADYRDPWINAQNYGMQSLSLKNKNAELLKQNYVFEHVDYISAPNSFLLEEVRQTYTGNSTIKAKFITLPHAFDPDDVFSKKNDKSIDEIKIVYGGTLYMGIDGYLEFFNKSVSFAKKNSLEKSLEINFYTNEHQKEIFFKKNSDVVKFSASIGETIFEKIYNCDFVLIFLTEHNKNYLTSKFYEFLPYNKPYLYVGPEGFVSDKIVKEGLGFILKKEEDLEKILNNYSSTLHIPKTDINTYSFDTITKQLLSHIS